MAIKVKFDKQNNPLPMRLILATRNGRKIRELPIDEVRFKDTLMNGSEISFTVYKEKCLGTDGKVDDDFWASVTDLKLAYCPEYDLWYEIYVDVNESTEIYKSIQATSLGEAELSQIKVYEIEVNTEEDIAREDYKPTVLFNPDDASCSLVERLLYKAPHYRIKHVDESIANIQRTFKFSDKTVYDSYQEIAKEIGCLFRFECSAGESTAIDRAISVYDLENHCVLCGNRGDFTDVCPKCGSEAVLPGYGEDTSIYVSRENLADEISFTTDTDSVKNCFRLEPGDDLMTATVMNQNPNGSQYIWYITDEMRSDMSDELKARLDAYDAAYERYQNEEEYTLDTSLLNSYNAIVAKYQSFNPDLKSIPAVIKGYPALMEAYYNTVDMQLFLDSGLMPNVEIETTDASIEAGKLTSGTVSPVAVANLEACTASTAANAALGVAKCLIRKSFQVKVGNSSYDTSTHVWTGDFIVTNYGNEEDTATSGTVTVTISGELEDYIRQKIQKATYQASDDATDITELFALGIADFRNELKKYGRQSLLAFREACQVVLDMLIQQGVADKQSWADRASSGEWDDLYTDLYLPYRDKAAAIESEIETRENEIAVVSGKYIIAGEFEDESGAIVGDLSFYDPVGVQNYIVKWRGEIHDALNFEVFLGDELWKEFASFRREDSYSNSNYISDGLDNAELFARASEFLDAAEHDIIKSATMQHSISASMANLLTMKEFQPIKNMFAVGNWIRVLSDGRVYRLRLSEYEINYDTWEMPNVEFSDVRINGDTASDIQSLLDKTRSMSTSYGAVAKQAEAGKKSQKTLGNWAKEGFSLTTKIVGGAENQEFIMDESGLTGREFIPETDGYSDEQIKIISHGVYVTNDGWKTAKAGLGRFEFRNPDTQNIESGFGVIADLLVGSMLLSEKAGIYNENNSIKMDENGLTIRATGSGNGKLFSIQMANGTEVASFDDRGNFSLGSATSIGGATTLGDLADDAITNVDVMYISWTSATSAPPKTASGWSTTAPEWEAGKYIWQMTVTTDGYGNISRSEPTCIQGAAGASGRSTTIIYLYKRSTTAATVDWTSNLTYTFETDTLSSIPSGWSRSIPTGTAPIYMTAASASSTGASDVIAYNEWSQPIVIAQNGTGGKDGANTATVFLYQRSTVVPTVPTSALTYTFSTGKLSGTLGGWSQTVPATNGKPCYVIQATAVSTGATDSIAASEWSSAVKFVEDGAAATTYSLTVSTAAVVKTVNNTFNPSTITLTAKSISGAGASASYAGRFKIETSTDGSTWSAKYASGANESSKTYTVPSGIVAIRCSLYAAGGTTSLLDQQTIPIVSDGAEGANGEPAYTVILTNENHTFSGGRTAAIAGNVTCSVYAYKGATRVAATIGTITGAPTGMSTSISNNGKTTAAFKVSVTTSMVTKNGTLTVPVTVDGKVFNKIFTYSLSGIGVKEVVEQYILTSSKTTTPSQTSTSWKDTQPTWASGKYIWTRSKVTWTDDSVTYTTPVLASGLNDANERSQEVQSTLDSPTALFNKFSNNGAIKGISMNNGFFWINADYINAGTMSASRIKGDTLTLGGSNNVNGTLRINNASGTAVVTANNNGITVSKGTISGCSLTLGGASNGSGTLTIYNASGVAVVTANNNGISIGKGSITGCSLTLGGKSNGNGTLTINDASGAAVVTANNTGININKGSIIGCTLTLGGSSNGNGSLSVRNASNAEIVSANNTGLHVKNTSGTEIVTANADGITINKGSINGCTLTLGGVDNTNGSLVVKDQYGNTVVEADQQGITAEAGSIGPFTINRTGIFPHGIFSENGSFIGLYKSSIELVYNYSGSSSAPCYIEPRLDGMRIRGDVYIEGYLSATQGKSRLFTTRNYGDRLLYCYETPSPMFGDVGEGVISEDGLCYVWLDPVFAETISTEQYQVFLQAYGDGSCYIEMRNQSYFIVRGTSGLRFGWEVKAKQSDLDQQRLERTAINRVPETIDYGDQSAEYYKELNEGRIAI